MQNIYICMDCIDLYIYIYYADLINCVEENHGHAMRECIYLLSNLECLAHDMYLARLQ